MSVAVFSPLFLSTNIIIFISVNIQTSVTYNVLVTTVGIAASQNLVMYRLAELLADKGHQVTVLKAEVFKDANTPKLKKIKKEIVYQVIQDAEVNERLRLGLQDNAWNSTESAAVKFNVIRQVFRQLSNSCRTFIADENSPALRKLTATKFDVSVFHLMDFCAIGLAKKLGIKGTIWMSTAFSVDFMTWYAGAPTPVSYVPAGPNPMPGTGFVDRLKNMAAFLAVNVVFQYSIVSTYTDIFRQRYGPNFPSFGEILHDTQLHYINSDPFFEYPRPILHKMIYVGGLTMENPEALDKNWQTVVNASSADGLVVFSLGSVTNTSFMPLEYKMAFLAALKRLKQTVIWRLEGDTQFALNVPNIIVANWIPQRDLLSYGNIKALITHGGYNSLTEATYMGVPLIMLPLFGDQYSNCKRVERLNVGVILNRENLTAEYVYDTLVHVVESKIIQNNAKRLGRMIQKRPHSSKQAAIDWVEYLAEFQDLTQLAPRGQQLNLLEYFMIDIAVFIFLSVFTVVFIWFYVLYRFCMYCTKNWLKKLTKGKQD